MKHQPSTSHLRQNSGSDELAKSDADSDSILPDLSDITPLDPPSVEQLVNQSGVSLSNRMVCIVIICFLYSLTTASEVYLENISFGLASFRPTAGVGTGVLLILGKLSLSTTTSLSRTGLFSIVTGLLVSEIVVPRLNHTNWAYWLINCIISSTGMLIECALATWLVQRLLSNLSPIQHQTNSDHQSAPPPIHNCDKPTMPDTCLADPLSGVSRIFCLFLGVVPSCMIGSWITALTACVTTPSRCLTLSHYTNVWLNRFLADLVGTLLITPLIVCIWTTTYRYRHANPNVQSQGATRLHRMQMATFGYAMHVCNHPWICIAELVSICFEVILVNCLVFGQFHMRFSISFVYEAPAIIIPFMSFLPPMLRWGSLGTTIAVLTSCTIATVGTLRGLGPLATSSLLSLSSSSSESAASATSNESLDRLSMIPSSTSAMMTTTFHIQWFILTSTVATLLLCGFFADLVRAASIVDRHVVVAVKRLLVAKREAERQRDLAQAAVTAKHRFLSSMSHEMRTPLNGVVGMVQALQDAGPLTDEQLSYIATINKSSNKLSFIMDRVLTVSQMESCHSESHVLQLQEVDLHVIIQDTIMEILNQEDDVELDIVYMIHPDIPSVITTDGKRLQHIISNLLDNAIRFTSKNGRVTVTVNLQPSPEKGVRDGDGAQCDVHLKFTISDTGVGMSEEAVTKLFQPFGQLDTSSTRLYGGCGLGLYVTSRLVRLFHGTISIDSQVGIGTQVHFTIQAAVSSPSSAPSPLPVTQPRFAWDRLSELIGKRLVLVHDNPCLLLSVHWFGIRMGLKVISIDTAAEAIKWTESKDNAADFYLCNNTAQANMLVDHLLALNGSSNTPIKIILVSHRLAPDPNPSIHRATLNVEIYTLSMPLMLTDLADRLVTRMSVLRPSESSMSSGGICLLTDGLLTKGSLTDAIPRAHRGRLNRCDTYPATTNETCHRNKAPRAGLSKFPLHILVAEDNLVNRKVITKALDRLGHTYETANNGKIAVERFMSRATQKAPPFDLVLMDLHMPVMDGFEAARAILSTSHADSLPLSSSRPHQVAGSSEDPIRSDKPLPSTLIIGISASVLSADLESCFASGMCDYVSKPFSFSELGKTIDKWSTISRQQALGSPVSADVDKAGAWKQ